MLPTWLYCFIMWSIASSILALCLGAYLKPEDEVL